jgi:hypothetical protein
MERGGANASWRTAYRPVVPISTKSRACSFLSGDVPQKLLKRHFADAIDPEM